MCIVDAQLSLCTDVDQSLYTSTNPHLHCLVVAASHRMSLIRWISFLFFETFFFKKKNIFQSFFYYIFPFFFEITFVLFDFFNCFFKKCFPFLWFIFDFSLFFIFFTFLLFTFFYLCYLVFLLIVNFLFWITMLKISFCAKNMLDVRLRTSVARNDTACTHTSRCYHDNASL